MKTTFFALLGLFTIGLLSAQEAKVPAPQAPGAADESKLMSIERDPHSRLLLITALVADTPMRMILDTGATHTILHKDSAKKLKKGVMWLNTSHLKFSGNTNRPEMMVANLQAGPKRLTRHPIAVLDLSPVRSMMGEEVDGIIGMDVLGSLAFTFDLHQEKYYWGSPENAKLTPLRGQMQQGGRMMVQAICGGKELSMLLDTGSAVTRVNAPDWAPGAGREVMTRLGNVNNTQTRNMVEGKPGDLEIAEGLRLKNVVPLLDEPGCSVLLGLDALSGSVLIHLPQPRTLYGQFFLAQP